MGAWGGGGCARINYKQRGDDEPVEGDGGWNGKTLAELKSLGRASRGKKVGNVGGSAPKKIFPQMEPVERGKLDFHFFLSWRLGECRTVLTFFSASGRGFL